MRGILLSFEVTRCEILYLIVGFLLLHELVGESYLSWCICICVIEHGGPFQNQQVACRVKIAYI